MRDADVVGRPRRTTRPLQQTKRNMPASIWYELAPSWLLIRMISFASGRCPHLPGMAHADHVLRVLRLAFDAAPALRDHEGLESLLAQAAQDVDGRDVGVALGAARVLAGREDRRRGCTHLRPRASGVSLRRTRCCGRSGSQALVSGAC